MNYKFPINLFIILEKTQPIIWTSNSLVPSHYIIYIDNVWVSSIFCLLKNEAFSKQTTLIDITVLDTLDYKKNSEESDIFFYKNRYFLLYTTYSYSTKIKLTILTNISKYNEVSIENFYKNANWLERECSEMYGPIFKKKSDTRRLLLDYSLDEMPMVRDYPCEGYKDVFFSFFEEQVVYVKNEFIEL